MLICFIKLRCPICFLNFTINIEVKDVEDYFVIKCPHCNYEEDSGEIGVNFDFGNFYPKDFKSEYIDVRNENNEIDDNDEDD